jgi:Zn-finger nucleic acid-binding protein
MLSAVTFQNVEVDRCNECQGIFFDAGEHHELKEVRGSGAIDTGNVATGKMYNDVKDVSCPRCQTKMFKISDVDQCHITVDVCPACRGVWFDAGEFKDFRSYTFSDYIKSLFYKKKKD